MIRLRMGRVRFRKKQMLQGAGSPLSSVSATTPPAPGSVFLFPEKDENQPAAPESGRAEDFVDLSDGARAKLQEAGAALLAREEGRGNLAEEEAKLIREALQETGRQLEILAERAGGNPETREAALRELEQLQGHLKNIGNRLGLMNGAATAPAGPEEAAFQSVVKGFRAQLKELDELFRDENRMPPGLLRLLREMTTFPRPREDSGFSKLV